jgi:quinolinate synthase
MPHPKETIQELKTRLGGDLVILAHHYQHDNVVRHADIVGDSLELARRVPELSASHIVFCGVTFMADSAAILAGPGQRVYNPEPGASCVMSEMAPSRVVAEVHRRLRRHTDAMPLAYVNSSAEIKALCGSHGGSVCTSANAACMLEWALDNARSVLFLPDKNLALNTARDLGVPQADQHVLDVRSQGERLDTNAVKRARLLIWPGCCAVHFRFKPAHVEAVRRDHPEARVLVHPECLPEVVEAADGAGSTSYLIESAEAAEEGAQLYIGTEINLVQRLARRFQGRRDIRPLAVSACANMGKTSEDKLAGLLQRIDAGQAEAVSVTPGVSSAAGQALDRMLAACAWTPVD